MTVAVLLIIGAGSGWGVLRALLPMVNDAGTMTRTNYRGQAIPVVGGIPMLAVTVAGLCAIKFLRSLTDLEVLPAESSRVLSPLAILILVTGLFGLVDDAFGTPATKGIRGHPRALARGKLTSGMVKLLTGLLAALTVASTLESSVGWVSLGTLTVASWVNVGNLLDLGPGRAFKGCIPVAIALILCFPDELAPVALLVGAAVGVVRADLRERVMLGDSGANPMGALVGFSALASGNHCVLVAFLAVGVALNIAAEFVSFSQVITAVPALRRLDLFGATEERADFMRRHRQQ